MWVEYVRCTKEKLAESYAKQLLAAFGRSVMMQGDTPILDKDDSSTLEKFSC